MHKEELSEKWNLVYVQGNREIQDVANFLESEYGDKNIGLHWSSALLNWKVGDLNPAGHGLIFSAILNGRTVGSVSLTFKRLYSGGQKYLMAEIGDAYTSKSMLAKSSHKRYSCSSKYAGSFQNTEYINSSIFARLATEAIGWASTMGVQGIYGTPNALALPGWIKRLDFKLVNTRTSRIRSRTLLTAKLFQIKKRVPSLVAQLFGYCLSFASQLLLFFPTIKLAKFQIDELKQQANSEFDDLWESSVSEGASLVKNKDWLSWRYQSHPDITYKIYTLRLKGRLCGWLVLRIRQSAEGSIITICDWLYRTDSALWVAFMYKVLQSLEYQNAVVRLWSCDNTPLLKDLWRLLALGGAYVNVIFKPLVNGESVFNVEHIFDEFSIGHTDNV